MTKFQQPIPNPINTFWHTFTLDLFISFLIGLKWEMIQIRVAKFYGINYLIGLDLALLNFTLEWLRKFFNLKSFQMVHPSTKDMKSYEWTTRVGVKWGFKNLLNIIQCNSWLRYLRFKHELHFDIKILCLVQWCKTSTIMAAIIRLKY